VENNFLGGIASGDIVIFMGENLWQKNIKSKKNFQLNSIAPATEFTNFRHNEWRISKIPRPK
jgi:hypothetical protein